MEYGALENREHQTTSVLGEPVSLFVRELTVLDYAYLDPKRGVLGGSLDIDAEFIGGLDDEGVVFDFSHAKKAVKKVIDGLCDHRLVCPKSSIVSCENHQVKLEYRYGVNSVLKYHCPEEALCILDDLKIDTTAILTYLQHEVMKVMPKNVDRLILHAREEDLKGAPEYRYTHGLKQHYGNCQRLLHGHRNRIDVEIDGAKNPHWESTLAAAWHDVHLAIPENCPNQEVIVGQRQDHLETVHIQYQSLQGLFEVWLPGESVYVMPYETTVENISKHLRECVLAKINSSPSSVKIWAYEGIRKGSLSGNAFT